MPCHFQRPKTKTFERPLPKNQMRKIKRLTKRKKGISQPKNQKLKPQVSYKARATKNTVNNPAPLHQRLPARSLDELAPLLVLPLVAVAVPLFPSFPTSAKLPPVAPGRTAVEVTGTVGFTNCVFLVSKLKHEFDKLKVVAASSVDTLVPGSKFPGKLSVASACTPTSKITRNSTRTRLGNLKGTTAVAELSEVRFVTTGLQSWSKFVPVEIVSCSFGMSKKAPISAFPWPLKKDRPKERSALIPAVRERVTEGEVAWNGRVETLVFWKPVRVEFTIFATPKVMVELSGTLISKPVENDRSPVSSIELVKTGRKVGPTVTIPGIWKPGIPTSMSVFSNSFLDASLRLASKAMWAVMLFTTALMKPSS